MNQTYILVDPNDTDGIDDGVVDRLEMTSQEAERKNDAYRSRGSDLRWVKEREK